MPKQTEMVQKIHLPIEDRNLLIGTGFETVFFELATFLCYWRWFSCLHCTNPSSERRLTNVRFDTGFFTKLASLTPFFASIGRGLISLCSDLPTRIYGDRTSQQTVFRFLSARMVLQQDNYYTHLIHHSIRPLIVIDLQHLELEKTQPQ